MSSFFGPQGGQQLQQGSDQHVQHGLPNYNNNYEHRFDVLQNTLRRSANDKWATTVHDGVQVFEVRFKCTQGDYTLDTSLKLNSGDFVRVEADRGYDIGVIFRQKGKIGGMEIPRKRILGLATQQELSILPRKMVEEGEAVDICRQMAELKGLNITIADVEFQFDRNKLTVVFASEGRVDFRELVRDMFSFFHIRIWMQKVSPSEALALMKMATEGASQSHSTHSQSGFHDGAMTTSHQQHLAGAEKSFALGHQDLYDNAQHLHGGYTQYPTQQGHHERYYYEGMGHSSNVASNDPHQFSHFDGDHYNPSIRSSSANSYTSFMARKYMYVDDNHGPNTSSSSSTPATVNKQHIGVHESPPSHFSTVLMSSQQISNPRQTFD